MFPFRPTRPHPRRSVLRKHEALVLENAQGSVIAVERGLLWVTLERDPRDIILAEGMRFEIDRPGRTIVAAEADSTLRLKAPISLRDRIAASVARALARLNGWGGRLSRRALPDL